MTREEVCNDFDSRIDRLIIKFKDAAAEIAAEMPSDMIAEYMANFDVGEHEIDDVNGFLLEAVGREAQKRLRKIHDGTCE